MNGHKSMAGAGDKTKLNDRSELLNSSQTSNLKLSDEMLDAKGLFWK